MNHQIQEDVLCERTLDHTARSRTFFALSIAFCALFLICTAQAVLSAALPSLSHILLGAGITLALIITCLELAVSSAAGKSHIG